MQGDTKHESFLRPHSLLLGTLLCDLSSLAVMSTASTQQDFPSFHAPATKQKAEVIIGLILFVSFLSRLTVLFCLLYNT